MPSTILHRPRRHRHRQALGGAECHVVVMPDADLDEATDALMGAAYGSAGERCMAVSVAVAVGGVGDKLLDKLVPQVRSLKVGPGTDPEAEMGPLVTRQHLDKVRSYVDLGIAEGAKLVVDGRGLKLQGYEDGFFLGGCLFDDVTPEMRIHKEEIFGPVLSVVRSPDFDSATKLVNDHEYGNGTALSMAVIEHLFHNPIGVFPNPAHSARGGTFQGHRPRRGRPVCVGRFYAADGAGRHADPADQRALHAPEGERLL